MLNDYLLIWLFGAFRRCKFCLPTNLGLILMAITDKGFFIAYILREYLGNYQFEASGKAASAGITLNIRHLHTSI